MNLIRDLLAFIEQSPTAFHAVQKSAEELEQNGFLPLFEGEEWKLEAGKGYYVTRNQSALIAFRVPQQQPDHFLITASHTDSPMFKLKHNYLSVTSDRMQKLNTEVYGGTILATWLDRPLSLAGRVILSQNGRFVAKNVNIDRDLLVIPSVAIHFNRTVNSGYAYNPAVDMLPLFSENESVTVRSLVASKLGCEESEIADMDLYVYNRAKGTTLGASNEFFSAPRIDDLASLWGCLKGFLNVTATTSAVPLFYAADNEETGSMSRQGADSDFLLTVLDRICEQFGADRRRLLAASMMLSADNAHAKHPNHPELSDAQNAPVMGGGVVIKLNAAQKYTTDAMSAALFAEICRASDVPVQYYANRSDLPGGSTLGSISNTHVPITSVDIGIAQLAMHSSWETAHCRDMEYFVHAISTFYGSTLRAVRDGEYHLTCGENPV